MSQENELEEVQPTAEEQEAALIDAVGEAVDEATPGLHEEDDDDDATNDDAGVSDAVGEGDDGAEGESGDDDSSDVDDASGADEADADGDDNAEDEDTDGADETAADDGETETPDADAEVDHINDAIPEGTNEKTAARIQGLIDIAKEQTDRAAQGDEIIAAITNTGADPEQFSNTIGFLSMYNSTDAAQRKQALEVARGVVRELSIELGEGTQDLLAEHEDLQAEVEAGTLDQARAVEIATSRAAETLRKSRAEAANTKTAAEKTAADNLKAGRTALTTFENTVKADPDYARLYPTFTAMLQPQLRNLHVSQWGEAAQTLFTELKAQIPATPAPAPKGPKRQPLRPKQGAGGSGDKGAEPTSALDALDSALAEG